MTEFELEVIGKTVSHGIALNLLMNKIDVFITNYLANTLQDGDYTVSSSLGANNCHITVEVKTKKENK